MTTKVRPGRGLLTLTLAIAFAAFPLRVGLTAEGWLSLMVASAFAESGSGKDGTPDADDDADTNDDVEAPDDDTDDNDDADHGDGNDTEDRSGPSGDDTPDAPDKDDDPREDDSVDTTHPSSGAQGSPRAGAAGGGPDPRPAGTASPTARQSAAVIGQSVREAVPDLHLRYRNGWDERIEGGRYLLVDPHGNLVANRVATLQDLARMRALVGQ